MLPFSGWVDRTAGRLGRRFYLGLALLFTVALLLDATRFHFADQFKQKAFDAMMRHRVVRPAPDPDIVIVDIDEASLAALAGEYGRWPWPRQVLGEFLEQLEAQQPRAVLFDILFSDPDVFNPDSDAYFDQAIAATGNTYFPVLRLPAASDSSSAVTPDLIPGVRPAPGAQPTKSPIAVILPHFPAALAGGRLGTHNIDPDDDGIARHYTYYRDEHGWRLPSLPARLAETQGWPPLPAERVLINWRGPAFTYRHVPFHEVYGDFLNKQKRRPADEFKGKLVIIGSTAPSLFDIKPTPMARQFPGVEVLATAIDNARHADYLRYPPGGRVPYLLLALAIVWATAWAFWRNTARERVDWLFGASQFILLAVSYGSLHLSPYYIDLTAPVTVGLAFYTLARLYARAADRPDLMPATGAGAGQGRVLVLRFRGPGAHLSRGDRRRLRRRLAAAAPIGAAVAVFQGETQDLWALLEGTAAVSWVHTEDAMPAAALAERLAAAVPDFRLAGYGAAAGPADGADDWRRLLAQALADGVSAPTARTEEMT